MKSDNAVVLAIVISAAGLILLSHPSAGVVWENLTEEDGLIDDHVLSLYESAAGGIRADCHPLGDVPQS